MRRPQQTAIEPCKCPGCQGASFNKRKSGVLRKNGCFDTNHDSSPQIVLHWFGPEDTNTRSQWRKSLADTSWLATDVHARPSHYSNNLWTNDIVEGIGGGGRAPVCVDIQLHVVCLLPPSPIVEWQVPLHSAVGTSLILLVLTSVCMLGVFKIVLPQCWSKINRCLVHGSACGNWGAPEQSFCVFFYLVRSLSEGATSAAHVTQHCCASVVVQRQALYHKVIFALTKFMCVEPVASCVDVVEQFAWGLEVVMWCSSSNSARIRPLKLLSHFSGRHFLDLTLKAPWGPLNDHVGAARPAPFLFRPSPLWTLPPKHSTPQWHPTTAPSNGSTSTPPKLVITLPKHSAPQWHPAMAARPLPQNHHPTPQT